MRTAFCLEAFKASKNFKKHSLVSPGGFLKADDVYVVWEPRPGQRLQRRNRVT